MKKCRSCGAPVEDSCDTICAYCGNPLGGGHSDEEQYSHQEYSQQHTAQQYSQHTSQNTYQQYPGRIIDQNYNAKQNEVLGRSQIAKILGIISLVFCTMFVIAVAAILVASSVLKDPNADSKAIANAKSARTLAIISLCLGVIFTFSTSPILNLIFGVW